MDEKDGKIVIGVEGDVSGINKALEDTEKKGKATASGIGGAFAAIGGAIAGAKIVGMFKSAFDEANKLEAALNRVESAARSFGQSTSKAKQAAQDLSKDGFLSLNQSASALSNLMATGLNVNQSRKFIEAAKDISAFGNTVGDAAGAVESGIKGIITGSSELVENLSPAMKTLSMRFTENKNKVGEAKAIQELYNGVLKLGNQYSGDAARYLDTAAAAQKRFEGATDAAAAAIGKSLQPAMKGLFSALTGIVEGFTSWFSGLNSGTQSLAVFSAGLASLVPIFLTISALNPFAWVAGAIAGLLALSAAVKQFTQIDPGKIADKYEETAKALEDIAEKTAAIEKLNVRTIKQNEELVKSQQELRDQAKALGVDYDALASKTKNLAEQSQMLRNIAREQAATIIRQRMDQLQALLPGAQNISSAQRLGISAGGVGSAAIGNLSNFDRQAIQAELQGAQAAFIRLYQQDQGGGSTRTAQAMASNAREARFIESQLKLNEIEKNRLFTIQSLDAVNSRDMRLAGSRDLGTRQAAEQRISARKQEFDNAYEDARQQREAVIRDQRVLYAEYMEDKATVDRLALDKQKDDAIRSIREQESAGEIIKEQAEARIQEVREQNAKKLAQLQVQEVTNLLGAANQIVGGIKQGGVAGFGQALSGGGGLGSSLTQMGLISKGGAASSLLSAAGTIGPLMGIAGSLIGGLSDIFGKSDAQRAAEAREQQRRDEEAKAILQEQANYQKSMLSLQEAAAKLPFEDLQRNLRLIDIQSQADILGGGDPAVVESRRLASRQAAIQSTLTSQAGAISGGQMFGGTGTTAQDLTTFLSERGAQSLAIQQFTAAFSGIDNNVMNPALGDSQVASLYGYRGKIPDVYIQQLDAYKARREQLKQQIQAAYGEYTKLATHDPAGAQAAYNTVTNISSNLSPAALAAATGNINAITSEIGSDTGIAENLLSTLEQSLANQQSIKDNTKKTADNTARITQMQETGILDLAAGGIRGFGAFFRGAFNTAESLINPTMPALSTPTAISNSLAIASLTRSWQDRTADGIESLVRIQTEALQLLAEIAINTESSTSGGMSQSDLIQLQAKIRSRLV